jgi:hypothetical protein
MAVVAMPAPVTPAPMTMPAHLFGLEAIHLALGGDGRAGILIPGRQFVFRKRMRQ